jgi:hypothetical protein
MIRMLIVGYGFGIRSERRLCEEVHLNLAYRWFCRLGLDADVPDRTIGASCRAQSFTRSMTSSLSSANTTASGGSFLSQVNVWPCAWRIASEAVKRLPKRAARSELSTATASVERRPWRWRTESWVNVLSLWLEAGRLVAMTVYG